jgi:HTH-type transcriptional regulator / antitoxin HigA
MEVNRTKAMEPRVITSREQYKEAMGELERLMVLDPRKGTPEADRLELFALILENYEKEHFPIESPTPLEAIKFRMEEQNLSPRDLEPFIGSRSKVSEVLSGKIPLSLRMIRELNRGLGIPYDVLIQEQPEQHSDIDWSRVPVAEMVKLGWIDPGSGPSRQKKDELARVFFAGVGHSGPVDAFFRRTDHTRSASKPDRAALAAWLARATDRAQVFHPKAQFDCTKLTAEAMKSVAQYSVEHDGPRAVRDFLLSLGVVLVVVPHLSKTRLDGAAFISLAGHAVVALTLRYDRVDNFWFTLLHELAHLARHSAKTGVFLDDLDVAAGKDDIEEEADAVARDAIVPRQIWSRSDAARLRTSAAILSLASQLRVHPALIAGRLRFETRNYHQFNNLVGHGQVRHLFKDELGGTEK